jgi:Tol biopolymer transport system component
MGEVYRARDTRLGRDVAIKVLPARLAEDPEFRQRLDREARAISSLSHPNICALYDIGHRDGMGFLVMEYLDGETLATRLTRGPLPLDQVLRYGIEIADALAAAHRKAVVHRDLKPGNVMLTRTGARLLDFGLAKPVAGGHAAAGVHAATVSAPLTSQGTLLGTFQYMSPEQLQGQEADARSDIFALGAVLYEMATGTRAFDGRTTASVIAAILEREPAPIPSLQPLAPAALDDVVRGCLAKDPEERWQTAHDVSLQLRTLRTRGVERESQSIPTALPKRRLALWGVAAIALFAAGLLAARYFATAAPPDAPELLRAPVLAPTGHAFTPNDFAISPDGRRVAFIAAGADGVQTLWVTSLESGQSAEVAGSDDAKSPFWAPDSRWIGFFARGKLMKVEPGGVGLQTVCDAHATARGGAWGPSGDILFSSAVFGPLVRVPAVGGTAQPVTQIPPDMPGEAHRFPQFLSDGRRFLFSASWTNQQRGGVYLASVGGGAPKLLSSEIRSRTVLAGGYLIYVAEGTVYARPFDERDGQFTGEPRALLRNEIAADWRFGDMPLSASANGRIVFQSRQTYYSQLLWFDRSGKELGVVGPPGYWSPALSPDGTRLAVTHDPDGTGRTNVWIHDLNRNVAAPLTTTGTHTALAWSRDGKWIAYSAMRSKTGIYRRPADGSGPEETIHESEAHLLVNSYSRDGAVLAMDFAKGIPELRAFDVQSKQSRLFDVGAEGSYSPDGRWIAHLGYNNTPGVSVTPAAGGGQIRVSSGPGSQARWRRDMTELYYIAPNRKMMVVPLTSRDGTLEPGPPRELFQTRVVQPALALFQYDVTADGQKFLINSLPREGVSAPLTLLVNWTAALSR